MEMMYKSVTRLTDEDRKEIGPIPPWIQKAILSDKAGKLEKASFFVFWIRGSKPIFLYNDKNMEEKPASVVDWKVVE